MSTLSRRKSAMLLFQIEQSFGAFVKKHIDNISQIPSSVIETIKERSREIEIKNVNQIVEKTYLSEIFHLAKIATENTSLNKVISEVSSLAKLYDLYEIRNAIAHPNRAFSNCYWYRVAAFASDPLIISLGIDEIQRCLISAENNSIIDPPDNWIENTKFKIKNNLPNQFDHDITGLIGREKENEKLVKLLVNPRVNTVAVVAPGGYGKTALVLDMLHHQVSNPKTSEYADAILFISLKVESLTLDGIKNLDSPHTIEQLKTELTSAAESIYEVPFNNFEECKEYLSDQKLFICVDNLETLLRDNSEAFNDLNLELPPSWRLLVTSRTIVNSNQSITLDPLNKKSCISLIHSYLRKKGGPSINNETAEHISSNCYFNPLAIRLTIDKLTIGSSINTALSTTKNEIAEFSFRNLVDSLSENANMILEALLLSGESDKIYLSSLLELTLDDLSDALKELVPTSLITRNLNESVEKYNLSSSIRDLLLLNTQNILLRNKILTKKETLTSKASEVDKKQKELSISTLQANHIPSQTNSSLKILLEKFHRCNRYDFEKISKILKEFQTSYDTYKRFDLFQREYARVLSNFKDYRTAIIHANHAIEIDSSSPLNYFTLASCYFENSDFKDAADIYLKLLHLCEEQGILDKRFLSRVNHGVFQSLLWLGDYDKIINLTDNWKEHAEFSGLLGGYRATAYKRSVENSYKINTNSYIEGMSNSISVMSDVFEHSGYLKSTCIQSHKLIDEIVFFCSKENLNDDFYEFCILGLLFIKNHAPGIINFFKVQKDGETSTSKIFNNISTLKHVDIRENPLHDFNLEALKHQNEVNIENYTPVIIYHVMKDANRKFARDNAGNQYFLTKENTHDSLYENWSSINEGTQVFVIPNDILEPGKAIPVLDIISHES